MVEVTGVSGAGPIWHEVMRRVLLGQPELHFAVPDGLVRAEVCATSGLLPTEYCPKTRWEWFIEGRFRPRRILPPAVRDRPAQRSAGGRRHPLAERDERVYLVLPPEAQDWAAARGCHSRRSMCTCWPAGRAGPFALADPYTVFRLTPLVPPSRSVSGCGSWCPPKRSRSSTASTASRSPPRTPRRLTPGGAGAGRARAWRGCDAGGWRCAQRGRSAVRGQRVGSAGRAARVRPGQADSRCDNSPLHSSRLVYDQRYLHP